MSDKINEILKLESNSPYLSPKVSWYYYYECHIYKINEYFLQSKNQAIVIHTIQIVDRNETHTNILEK